MSNLGPVKPHVRHAAELIQKEFGITNIGGWRAIARDPTGHPSGNAIDVHISNREQGDRVAAWLIANHKALGIEYILWWQRSWRPSRNEWRQMEDRGDPTSNHLDHLHVQFLPTFVSDPTLTVSPAGDFQNVGLSPGDALSGLKTVFGLLMSPQFWLRAATVAVGVVLLIVGLLMFTGKKVF